jgi:hypothetical protein
VDNLASEKRGMGTGSAKRTGLLLLPGLSIRLIIRAFLAGDRVDQGTDETLTYLEIHVGYFRDILVLRKCIPARLLAIKGPANLGRSRELHGSADLLRIP